MTWYLDPETDDGAPCAICGDPNGCRETPTHHERYLASDPFERAIAYATKRGTDDADALEAAGVTYYAPMPDALDVVDLALQDASAPDRITRAKRVLAALEAAGYRVLGPCDRCDADPTSHWCADLEETYS